MRARGGAGGPVDADQAPEGGGGALVRLAGAALAGVEAALRLPATTVRLVVRLDELVGVALEIGTELGPPLRRLVPLLDEMAGVMAEGAPLLRAALPSLQAAAPALEQLAGLAADATPLLRRMLPVLEAASPSIEQLGSMGGDLVEVLDQATPGLRRLLPLLDSLDAARLAGLLDAADTLVPELARVVAGLPPGLVDRLLGLLDVAEVDLAALRVVGDTQAGLAAVTANTDHLVTMLDDLYAQLRAIPGTGALLRRGRRQRGELEGPPLGDDPVVVVDTTPAARRGR